jgi:hypothetical protein
MHTQILQKKKSTLNPWLNPDFQKLCWRNEGGAQRRVQQPAIARIPPEHKHIFNSARLNNVLDGTREKKM